MTDEAIRSIFQGAGDFIARELMCSGLRLYAYMIDGLVSGSDASEYIVRPYRRICRGKPWRNCMTRPWGDGYITP